MSFEFRETTPAEISHLVQEVLDTSAFVERSTDPEPFVAEAPRIFADEPRFRIFALAREDRQPVGFVMVLPGEDRETLDIGPTYVTAEVRGQGLGKELVGQVVNWARGHGVDRLVVATWGANARARHVFESVGFSFSREELGTRVDGDSTVHYELEFSRPTGDGDRTSGGPCA
jgi:GNAT superfamily N-acetyltransferase